MNRLRMALEVVALLAFVAVCVVVCVLAMQVRHTLQDADARLAGISAKASSDLEEGHRLILEAALTASEARKASAEERKALPQITARTVRAIDALGDWMAQLQRETASIGASQQQVTQATVTAIGSVNATVRDAQPVLAEAQQDLSRLGVLETDLDRQANDPAIASSLHNVDKATAAVAASAADVQGEVHAITHPGWVKRVWNGVLDVVHVFNPL